MRAPLSAFVLFSASALLLSACGNGDSETLPARPVLVQQPLAGAGAVQAFAGEVRARHEAQLSFRVGGKVTKRLVDVGDKVTAGQALAELDPQDLRLAREGAAAQLQAAQADARLAEAEFERFNVMFERQLVSRSMFEARRSTFEAARSRVELAKAQRDAAGNQATYGVLRAPQAGVIALRQIEAGQVVTSGQAAFGLAVEGEREIAIALPEADVARFNVGDEVLVEVWASPGERIPGTLREISPAADAQARTYAARVSLALPEGVSVGLGQSARVFARNAGVAALAVPLSALTEIGGKPTVWVLASDRRSAHPVVVETGAFSETDVPVLSGLKAKDWVVISGVHLMRADQPVLPVDRDNRPITAARASAAAE